MSSVKTNYALNLTNTITGMLFPLLVFPYVSRIMLADGMGIVNFYTSVIQYVIMLTALGIPLYAVREIAKVRDNADELNKVSLEILSLHAILTIAGYIVLFILCFSVDKLQENLALFLILSVNVLFTTIGCEWFYQGIENFKYIMIRGLVVKIVAVAFLFLFVHDRDDLLIYGAYTVIGSVGGNLFNFFKLREYLHPSKVSFSSLHPFRHLKPVFRIFILNVVISIYMQLDVVMLGFMKDASAVGYFSASLKVCTMLMGITTTLVSTLIPRMSNLFGHNRKDEFDQLAQKTVDFSFIISTPIVFMLILEAPSIIAILCGPSFGPAILTMQILAPQMLIITLAYILGSQILLPQGKEKIFIWATIWGAAISLVLNLILIPRYAQEGAAVGTVVAQATVLIALMVMGRKYLPVKYSSRHYLNCLLASVVMFVVAGLAQSEITSVMLKFSVGCVVGVLAYAICLFILRDNFFLIYTAQLVTKLMYKIKR